MKVNCPFCESQKLRVHQKNGHAYSTMYRCLKCNRFFSERRFTGYSGLKLQPEKIVQTGISILSFPFTRKPTPLTLSCQTQTALASLRW